MINDNLGDATKIIWYRHLKSTVAEGFSIIQEKINISGTIKAISANILEGSEESEDTVWDYLPIK